MIQSSENQGGFISVRPYTTTLTPADDSSSHGGTLNQKIPTSISSPRGGTVSSCFLAKNQNVLATF